MDRTSAQQPLACRMDGLELPVAARDLQARRNPRGFGTPRAAGEQDDDDGRALYGPAPSERRWAICLAASNDDVDGSHQDTVASHGCRGPRRDCRRAPALAVHAQWQRLDGEVFVRDNELVRDGHEWIPHGFYQIAFETLPGFPGLKPFWAIASQNFSRGEYDGMRRAGADSVRIQVSQPGLDPKNPFFTTQFRERVISAVRPARASGLSVIISVQDETQSGETAPTDLRMTRPAVYGGSLHRCSATIAACFTNCCRPCGKAAS